MWEVGGRGVSPQGCNQHQQLGLGQLCGGLFMSFWLTFYLQLTKEQTSIPLQVCESCISCEFLYLLDQPPRISWASEGAYFGSFLICLQVGLPGKKFGFPPLPFFHSSVLPSNNNPSYFFFILFNSALTVFEHILNKDWSSKALLGTFW